MCSMEQTEILIEIVKKYSILYDLSHPDYKNIRKKDKVWEEAGLELGKNGEWIKKKWKNLRDTYAKYLRSIKTTTGQAAKKSYKNWQWSAQMEFFRPFLAFAQTDSNVRDIEGQDLVSQNQAENEHINEVSGTEANDEESVHSPISILESESAPSVVSSATSSLKRPHVEKKNCSSVETVVNYLQNKNSKTVNDLIFAGYAKTVNTFSAKRQAVTKMKIAQILMEEEPKQVEEMESASRPSSSANVSTATSSPTSLSSAYNSPENTYIQSTSSEKPHYISLQPPQQNSFHTLGPRQSYTPSNPDETDPSAANSYFSSFNPYS